MSLMKYLPKNIFLDTNIFESNNFFHGTSIHGLLRYAKEGIIKFYMTDISYNEIISRIEINLFEAKNDINQYANQIDKSRILKNVQKYQDITKLKYNVNDLLAEIKKQLDVNIENSNIQFIKPDGVDINEIFYAYYHNLPPFNSKPNKKHEFPDAFIIKTIESWCKINKTKMIFVTKDNDFKDYKSSRIIFMNDLNVLLDKISKYYDYKKGARLIPRIEKRIIKYENKISDLINEKLDGQIIYDLPYEMIGEIKRSNSKYIDHQITGIWNDRADVSYNVEIKISFLVYPSQTEIYDDLTFRGNRPKMQELSIKLTCDLEFHNDSDSNIRLKWINSNEFIKLSSFLVKIN